MSLMRLPIIRHGLTAWDKQALPQSEFDRRLERVRAELRSRGLKALIVYSDMPHSGRAAYFINSHVFDPRMPSLVLVTADAFEAVLKVTARDLSFFQQFTEAHLSNADFLSGDLSIKFGELAREHRLIGTPVALVGARFMPTVLRDKITALFGAETINDGEAMLWSIQRDKSAAERALMRQGADLARQVHDEIARLARPGLREQELMARADYIARKGGAQDVDVLIHTSRSASSAGWPAEHFPFRPVGLATLEEGEAVGLFVALQFQGYWVELSETIFIGTPSARQAEALQKAQQAFTELLAGLHPGSNRALGERDEHQAVWVHGTGGDRLEPPHSGEGTLALGDMLAAHVAVRQGDEAIFVGRQVEVGADRSVQLRTDARNDSSET
jgi:Xaa-Pro aminopeptidase